MEMLRCLYKYTHLTNLLWNFIIVYQLKYKTVCNVLYFLLPYIKGSKKENIVHFRGNMENVGDISIHPLFCERKQKGSKKKNEHPIIFLFLNKKMSKYVMHTGTM